MTLGAIAGPVWAVEMLAQRESDQLLVKDWLL